MENSRFPDTERPQEVATGIVGLPTETICNIFSFLSPQDLIHLRAVSKLFSVIIQDPSFWRTIYASARYPLPPGPFAWQSLQFLQRALVYSARLARSWTTQPLTLVSTKTHSDFRSLEDEGLRWVRGRWVILRKNMKQLYSYDIETGVERLLWGHRPFSNWAVTSLMIPQGHFIYIAIHLAGGRIDDPVKLLEYVVDDDTGHLARSEVLDVPTWCLSREAREYTPRILVSNSSVPYVCISLNASNKQKCSLVFDPGNRQFYKFPLFRTRLEFILNYHRPWSPQLIEVYYTPTHILVFNRSYDVHGISGNVEVIQAFAFPTEDCSQSSSNSESRSGSLSSVARQQADNERRPNVVSELRLTHEMFASRVESRWLYPVHHTTDPITQTTTIRFLHTYCSVNTHSRFGFTDCILPGPAPPADAGAVGATSLCSANTDDDHPNSNVIRSANPVLSIHVSLHELFSLPGLWRDNLVDVSDNGFVRGFCVVRIPPNNTYYDFAASGMVRKFTIDARGEQGAPSVVMGNPSPPWVGMNMDRCHRYAMDGVTGKMWYVNSQLRLDDSTGRFVDRNVLAVVDHIK